MKHPLRSRIPGRLIIFHPESLLTNNSVPDQVHVPNFGGKSGSKDRGGGDNSIQFINIGREGDKSFKEWRRKIGGWKGG